MSLSPFAIDLVKVTLFPYLGFVHASGCSLVPVGLQRIRRTGTRRGASQGLTVIVLTVLYSASYDILRLYDLREQENSRHSAVPFLIVPGHRTGVISALHIDPTCRFMISTAGNRGWEGSSTEVLLGYEIGVPTS